MGNAMQIQARKNKRNPHSTSIDQHLIQVLVAVVDAKHSDASCTRQNNSAFNFPFYMVRWPDDILFPFIIFGPLLLTFPPSAFIASTLVLAHAHFALLDSLTMAWKFGLVLLSLATIARPQGNIGGTQYPPCTSPAQDYAYKGCFSDSNNGPHMQFDFQVIPNTTVAKENYPNFGTTMTPTSCQTACRGHGYKWSASYNGGSCYCSSIWPAPNATSSTQNSPQFPLYNPTYTSSVPDTTCNQ